MREKGRGKEKSRKKKKEERSNTQERERCMCTLLCSRFSCLSLRLCLLVTFPPHPQMGVDAVLAVVRLMKAMGPIKGGGA